MYSLCVPHVTSVRRPRIILSRFGLILANCASCTGLSSPHAEGTRVLRYRPGTWSSSTSRHFSPSLGRPRRPHALTVKSQLAGARQRLPKHPRGSVVERACAFTPAWTPTTGHRREDEEGEAIGSVAVDLYILSPSEEDEDLVWSSDVRVSPRGWILYRTSAVEEDSVDDITRENKISEAQRRRLVASIFQIAL